MKPLAAAILLLLATVAVAQQRTVQLPSSKVILKPVPGAPQRGGSFTATAVVSPDRKYVAFLQDGYGGEDTDLAQSIAILEVATNKIAYFPDARLRYDQHQTYFQGLAFSLDGKRLFASVGSITRPTADPAVKATGNGIAVYNFEDGKVSPAEFFPIAPQAVAAGKKIAHIAEHPIPQGTQVPFPAGLTTTRVNGQEVLLVCDNYSDDVLELDTTNGQALHRFDLSDHEWVPAAFPYAVIVNKEGTRAWVSLWNASAVAELDLAGTSVARTISVLKPENAAAAGSHPTALLLSSDEKTLYVALANRDAVALVDVGSGQVTGSLDTKLQIKAMAGEYPTALAESSDGKTMFVANASGDAVAVYRSSGPLGRPAGFIPTEWYPTALAVVGDNLYVAAAKSTGTGPNSISVEHPTRPSMGQHPYIPTMLRSSIATINIPDAMQNLPALTKQVMESNLMSGRSGQIAFKNGGVCGEAAKNCPIKHVLYIIKENRTYDQIFGDLSVGNGDPSLTMYGKQVTPNEHAMALEFGVVDNFYDSGEVSGVGHVWSDAAITSDYNERTWQLNYRHERTYDFQGSVANESPMDQNQPDPNEPGTGYLWTSAARHHLTYRNYQEFIPTAWCDSPPDSWGGGPRPEDHCPPDKYLHKGDPLPAELQFHGQPATVEFPWLVPVVGHDRATKPELVGHFSPRYGDFRLDYPDQYRANIFLNEFEQWVNDRKSGRDTMPQLITMALPNDHTTALRANFGTPDAMVADNDLALGRIVEAISHSPYWDDTVICVLEDDAQDGVDHVDAHRSIALVISKYAPAKGTVDSHFYTTVNMVRTIELLLGLPPMNNNDAHAAAMAPLFSGDGAQPPFTADTSNRDNGRLYKQNPAKGSGAAASAKLDWSRPDAANNVIMNRILWRAAMGKRKMPAAQHTVFPAGARVADEDDK